jgi:hypothetical protein
MRRRTPDAGEDDNIPRFRVSRFISSHFRRVSCSKHYFSVRACAITYRQDGIACSSAKRRSSSDDLPNGLTQSGTAMDKRCTDICKGDRGLASQRANSTTGAHSGGSSTSIHSPPCGTPPTHLSCLISSSLTDLEMKTSQRWTATESEQRGRDLSQFGE